MTIKDPLNKSCGYAGLVQRVPKRQGDGSGPAKPPAMPRPALGFTLTELSIVLLVVALLLGGLLMPLSAQVDLRNLNDTRKTLAEAQEALAGFAVANGRLPCPASVASSGQESFATGGDPANGNCSNFYDGFLPAATLGLAAIDQDGYAIDAWFGRIRYGVFSGTINSVSNPFTRTDGMRAATMSSISAAASLLSVCSTASGITASNCGTAAKLAGNAPAVVLSLGKNTGSGGAGMDESENLDNDRVYLHHHPTPAGAANGEFDDIVIWLSPYVLYNRMITAGKLP